MKYLMITTVALGMLAGTTAQAKLGNAVKHGECLQLEGLKFTTLSEEKLGLQVQVRNTCEDRDIRGVKKRGIQHHLGVLELELSSEGATQDLQEEILFMPNKERLLAGESKVVDLEYDLPLEQGMHNLSVRLRGVRGADLSNAEARFLMGQDTACFEATGATYRGDHLYRDIRLSYRNTCDYAVAGDALEDQYRKFGLGQLWIRPLDAAAHQTEFHPLTSKDGDWYAHGGRLIASDKPINAGEERVYVGQNGKDLPSGSYEIKAQVRSSDFSYESSVLVRFELGFRPTSCLRVAETDIILNSPNRILMNTTTENGCESIWVPAREHASGAIFVGVAQAWIRPLEGAVVPYDNDIITTQGEWFGAGGGILIHYGPLAPGDTQQSQQNTGGFSQALSGRYEYKVEVRNTDGELEDSVIQILEF